MNDELLPELATARRATAFGLAAVALWSLLATLTTLTREVPPFQLAAMSFLVASLVGVVWARLSGESLAALRAVPWPAWALGVYGLLGFHVCYFLALRHAPALEANLVNYSWPLVIVLLSGLLPARHGGRRLTALHVLGAGLGFAGTAVILAGASAGTGGSGTSAGVTGSALVGYAFAAASALIWASYSVLSRLLASVPSISVAGTSALTAVGALAGHLLLETSVWPSSAATWVAVLAQGLGPVGIAFYLWDHGVKRGDLRVLGAASYAAPLLSSLLLAALGLSPLSLSLLVAALLISTGAALAGYASSRQA